VGGGAGEEMEEEGEDEKKEEAVRWRCRERRWAAVDLLDGKRVVDVVPLGSTGAEMGTGPVRVAGGFGGLRV